MSLFGYIKGISPDRPDQYDVHAHCKRTKIVKIPPPLCGVKKSSVVRESSWVKQLTVDKILTPTSLKVSGYNFK
jgi:hypothetical protein